MSRVDDEFNSGALCAICIVLFFLFEITIVYTTHCITHYQIWNEAVHYGHAIKIKTNEGDSFIWKNMKEEKND
jgi:hypothetical protein